MGLGDWLMATAQARKLHNEHKLRCVFTNGVKQWYEPAIFKGNPIIPAQLDDGEKYLAIPNFPGCRPYILGYDTDRFIWNPSFKAVPGELYLDKEEKAAALPAPYIVVEPSVKGDAQINKDWGWDNWVELTRLPYPWLQMGERGKRSLPGVPMLQTSFRQALGVLAGASLLVTTDGALHHAAAAMGVPAVVIWGGFTSPENLGYDAHENVWSGSDPCGIWKHRCPHCAEAMKSISVQAVADAIERALERDQRDLATGSRETLAGVCG